MGGYNPHFDIPINPWNADRWSGASFSDSGVATAAGLFGSLGSDTGGSIRFPAAACGTVGLTAEAVAAQATYPSRRDDYGPWFRGWLDLGAKVTGAEYARANALRSACTGHLRRVFDKIDLLACPSVSATPTPVTPDELYGPMPDPREPVGQRFTVPFDYNGAPTLTVPCGMNGEGLPLSLQFAGRPLSEPLLCQIGHAYEQATEWHKLHLPNEDGV